MKTLFLLRHAKSSWSEPGLADFNRPLNERGRRAAPLIARYLAHCGLLPDLILCSAAQRTRETLALMLPGGLACDAVLRIESGLYGADAATLLRRLKRIETEVDCVLLIAHNPGLEDLAAGFAVADPSRCAGVWTRSSLPPPWPRSRSTRRAGLPAQRHGNPHRLRPAEKISPRSAGNHVRRGSASRPGREKGFQARNGC